MENENIEISKQLKSIKKWIILGAVSFLLIAISAIVFTVSMVTVATSLNNEFTQTSCGKEDSNFSKNEVSSLLNKGDTEAALLIINKRLETHPNDSYAIWFKARAYYLKEEWDTALDLIDKTEFLAPSWKEKYTDPLRQQIEKSRP